MTGQRAPVVGTHDDVRVRRIRVAGRRLVAKSATGRRRSELRREAELLGHLEQQRVVGLTALRESDDRTDMITDDAGDHTLADPAAMTPDELFALLIASADAVSDLHRAGWSHGAICAEHLIIGNAGGVTLCSLGSAAMHHADDNAVIEDLRQLRAVIHAGLRHRDHDWSLPQRRRWRHLTHRARRRLIDRRPRCTPEPDSARALAESLRSVVAPNRPAAPTPRTKPRMTPPPARVTRTSATLVAAAALVGVSALIWSTASPPSGVASAQPSPSPSPGHTGPQSLRSRAPGPTSAPPSTTEPHETVAISGNEIRTDGLTFRAGTSGDRLALADPDCTGTDRVMLLRPSTGQLFEFPEWPSSGRPARAQLRSVHPGAVDLETVDPALHGAAHADAASVDPRNDPDHQCGRLVLRYSGDAPSPGPPVPAPVSASGPHGPSSQEEP